MAARRSLPYLLELPDVTVFYLFAHMAINNSQLRVYILNKTKKLNEYRRSCHENAGNIPFRMAESIWHRGCLP